MYMFVCVLGSEHHSKPLTKYGNRDNLYRKPTQTSLGTKRHLSAQVSEVSRNVAASSKPGPVIAVSSRLSNHVLLSGC